MTTYFRCLSSRLALGLITLTCMAQSVYVQASGGDSSDPASVCNVVLLGPHLPIIMRSQESRNPLPPTAVSALRQLTKFFFRPVAREIQAALDRPGQVRLVVTGLHRGEDVEAVLRAVWPRGGGDHGKVGAQGRDSQGRFWFGFDSLANGEDLIADSDFNAVVQHRVAEAYNRLSFAGRLWARARGLSPNAWANVGRESYWKLLARMNAYYKLGIGFVLKENADQLAIAKHPSAYFSRLLRDGHFHVVVMAPNEGALVAVLAAMRSSGVDLVRFHVDDDDYRGLFGEVLRSAGFGAFSGHYTRGNHRELFGGNAFQHVYDGLARLVSLPSGVDEPVGLGVIEAMARLVDSYVGWSRQPARSGDEPVNHAGSPLNLEALLAAYSSDAVDALLNRSARHQIDFDKIRRRLGEFGFPARYVDQLAQAVSPDGDRAHYIQVALGNDALGHQSPSAVAVVQALNKANAIPNEAADVETVIIPIGRTISQNLPPDAFSSGPAFLRVLVAQLRQEGFEFSGQQIAAITDPGSAAAALSAALSGASKPRFVHIVVELPMGPLQAPRLLEVIDRLAGGRLLGDFTAGLVVGRHPLAVSVLSPMPTAADLR